jgi:hypothetical protein
VLAHDTNKAQIERLVPSATGTVRTANLSAALREKCASVSATACGAAGRTEPEPAQRSAPSGRDDKGKTALTATFCNNFFRGSGRVGKVSGSD